ncbi:MAG: PHP domain-containing protein [Deltaproteobacteria bacterium]|nr:PHP domain-containing protein [Deltaproteobacteria bacterium]
MRHERFVHLHVHSDYTFFRSTLSSALSVETLVQAAAGHRQPAVALTDRMSVAGAPRFRAAALKAGVKPIIGSEVLVGPDNGLESYHLILLADGRAGYSALCELLSMAANEQAVEENESQNIDNGFKQTTEQPAIGEKSNKPRLQCCRLEWIEEFSKVLIALMGCHNGSVGTGLSENPAHDYLDRIVRLKEVFKGDRLFVEVQDHLRPGDGKQVSDLARIANELDLKLVATNDCRWHDRVSKRAIRALWRSREDLQSLYNYDGDFSLCSRNNLQERFSNFKDALDNTMLVAGMCKTWEPPASRQVFNFSGVEFEPGKQVETTPEKKVSNHDLLKKIAWDNLEQKIPAESQPEVYFRRLNAELDELGDDAYRFLLCYLAGNAAESVGAHISLYDSEVAGSVMAFAMGLTDVDPVLHRVSFVGRKARLHVTIGSEKKQDLLKAMVYKLGGIEGNFHEVKACLVPSIQVLYQRQALKELSMEGELEPGRFEETAQVLVGLAKGFDEAAVAVAFSNRPLVETMPLKKRDDGLFEAMVDSRYLGDLGAFSFEPGVSRALDVLTITMDQVRDFRGHDPESTFGPENPAGIKLIARGSTIGIPSLDQGRGTMSLKELAPSSLQEVATLIALNRHEFVNQGEVPKVYARRATGQEIVPQLGKDVDELLAETFGLVLFRDQVLELATTIAGFSRPRADALLSAIKNGNTAGIVSQKKNFIDGLKKRKIDSGVAEDIFRSFMYFPKQGLTRAEALSRAELAMHIAGVKASYRPEFTAALLSIMGTSASEVERILSEAVADGLTILGPDVNFSGLQPRLDKGRLRLGLAQVKRVGEQAGSLLVQEREQRGVFSSFQDLLERIGPPIVARDALKNLVLAGACEILGSKSGSKSGKQELIESLEEMLSMLLSWTGRNVSREGHQTDLFPTESRHAVPVELAGNRWIESMGFDLAHILDTCGKETMNIAEAQFMEPGSEVTCSGEVISRKSGLGKAADTESLVIWDGTGLLEADIIDPLPSCAENMVTIQGKLGPGAACLQDARIVEHRSHGDFRVLKVEVAGLKADPHILKRLRRIFINHPGSALVRLEVGTEDQTRVTVELPEDVRVHPGDELFKEIEEILGEGTWSLDKEPGNT